MRELNHVEIAEVSGGIGLLTLPALLGLGVFIPGIALSAVALGVTIAGTAISGLGLLASLII
ncbi:hypothetical protein ABEH87_14835 [Erwinia sp. Eh17-17]|uniref:hypothetical protein n=1 Tax=Erwinia sp. Eh17-17 TaxID=3080330 RepID=UPI00320982B9